MEKERETLLREQEKMLEHKLKVNVDGVCQCQTDGALTSQKENCYSKTCNSNCDCCIKVHMGLTEALSS